MCLEKIVGIHISDDASDFLTQKEAVHWIEDHLPRPPNRYAVAVLERLVDTQRRPGPAQAEHGDCSDHQGCFHETKTDEILAPSCGIYLAGPAERARPRKSRWRQFMPTKASVLLLAATAMIILL